MHAAANTCACRVKSLRIAPGGRGGLGRSHFIAHALAQHRCALLHELGDPLRFRHPLRWRLGRPTPWSPSKVMLHRAAKQTSSSERSLAVLDSASLTAHNLAFFPSLPSIVAPRHAKLRSQSSMKIIKTSIRLIDSFAGLYAQQETQESTPAGSRQVCRRMSIEAGGSTCCTAW